MKFFIMLLVIASVPTDAICVNIRNGIERYELYRETLEGKRVGIVANHTSMVEKDNIVLTFCGIKGLNWYGSFRRNTVFGGGGSGSTDGGLYGC